MTSSPSAGGVASPVDSIGGAVIRIRRLLALVAAAAAVSLGASSCDSSPYAAVVDGQEIKQTALQAELRDWVGNQAYVQALARANARSTAQNQVSVAGSAPGTYSAAFTTFVLDGLVQNRAVHRFVAAGHQLPGGDVRGAARGAMEADRSGYWLGFPADFRDRQVSALADLAALQPPLSETGSRSALVGYNNARRFFFSRVCTRQVSVSVAGPSGRVDFAASKSEAEKVASRYNSTAPPGGRGPGRDATLTCFTQRQLEDQGLPLFNQVLALAPGHAAAPERTATGYRVLAVESRDHQPFTSGVAAVIGLLQAQAPGTDSTKLVEVLTRARVTVDPAFGTWNHSQLTVQASTVPLEIQQKLNGTAATVGRPGNQI